ncbi:MAG: PadR family transcriptional regulator [Mycobacteriaceae bacterium]
MSPTRLLVLGVVRFAQPVHGYDVRRELLSWHIEDAVNVKPGSIYSALKTLERDGHIVAVGRERAGGRPERTSYALTVEGEQEFQILLRTSWWGVEQPMEPLVPALCMLEEMSRAELIAALDSRIERLRGADRRSEFLQATIAPGATGADGGIPDHAREPMMLLQARARAEIDWATGFRQRLHAGAYTMAGEPGAIQLGPGRGWPRKEVDTV